MLILALKMDPRSLIYFAVLLKPHDADNRE